MKRVWFVITASLLGSLGILSAADSPKKPTDADIVDDPALPRVLIIGDSVSMAYTRPLRQELAGRANVHHPDANCGSTKIGLRDLDKWLGATKWDIIHFNWGLHDLGYRYADDTNLNAKGEYATPHNGGHQNVPPADYEKNLRELVARLKKTGTKLIFATTTPVSANLHSYVKDAELPYNEAALRVMKDNGIEVNDLWTQAKPQIDALQIPGNPHFTDKGSAALAKQIAGVIQPMLPKSQKQPWAVFKGKTGLGAGKRIVFVTGDDEYKSEESMPMMAHSLAERHGFDCTVLFAINKETCVIDTNQKDNIPGLESLNSADLMVMFTRFRALPDAQMKFIDDYLKSGKPVIGLRTATHAFSFPKDNTTPYASYSFNDASGGFGRQVLGQTWVNHWGNHGKQSTRGVFAPSAAAHPILRGIADGEIWGPTNVYEATLPLPEGCKPLLLGHVLQGMKPDDAPVVGEQMNGKWKKLVKVNDPMMPIAWTWQRPVGAKGRVFTSTIGGAMAGGSDFANEGMRRMFVNACYWAVGLDNTIPPKADVTPVAVPHPFKRGVRVGQ